MSENKHDVPNLGVHMSLESAEEHFNSILEDRKNDNKLYKCKIYWVNNLVLLKDDLQGCIKEAYIKHPKTKYEKSYVEMLRIEWYYKDNKDILLELI